MTTAEPFDEEYARAYDLLYREKDYSGECALIDQLLGRTGRVVRSVLDLGCGTGGHALPLAQKGYDVTGIDRSAAMLGVAAEKARALHVKVRFQRADIGDLDLGQRFDAGLMMFAVLGYQVEESALANALRTVRRHLAEGGLFVFDVWYGPAVVHQKPSERFRVVEGTQGTVIRLASTKLEQHRNACTVTYRLWHLLDGKVLHSATETHSVRYFFKEELEHALRDVGLRLLQFGAFPDLDRQPDENTWNAIGIAVAE